MSFNFGQTPTTQAGSAFGATPAFGTGGSLFGNTATTGTGLFGPTPAAQQQPAGGLFGAQPAVGATSSQQPTAFGATTFGGFGAQQPTSSIFGQQQQTPAPAASGFSFSSATQPGTSQPSLFGATQTSLAAPSFNTGLFSTPAAPAASAVATTKPGSIFGATPTPSFGATATSSAAPAFPAFGGGISTAAPALATTSAPAFSFNPTGATGTSLFGAKPAEAVGTATPQQPAGSLGGFGAQTSTPFGATQPSFGNLSTPSFNTGLFSSTPAAPAASAAATANTTKPASIFGSTAPSALPAFGATATTAAPTLPAFGATTTTAAPTLPAFGATTTTAAPTLPAFGATATSSAAPSFPAFGGGASTAAPSAAATTSAPTFSFNLPGAATTTTTAAATLTPAAPKLFGATTTAAATSVATTAPPAFGFGTSAATTTPAAEAPKPAATFNLGGFGGSTTLASSTAPATSTSTSAPTTLASTSVLTTLITPAVTTTSATTTDSGAKPAAAPTTSTVGFSITSLGDKKVQPLAPAGSVVPAPAATAATPQITFGKLEEQINIWMNELSQFEADFYKQGQTINSWDSLLIANGQKLIGLNQTIEKLSTAHRCLDHQLDFIISQQKELEQLLEGIEENKHDVNTNNVNTEREHTYLLVDTVYNELNTIGSDLKEFIKKLNESRTNQELNDPLIQISKILNSHMDVLQWIESQVKNIRTA